MRIFFFKVQSEFSVQNITLKSVFIDNQYKIIYGPVRSECSSCRVKKWTWVRECKEKDT